MLMANEIVSRWRSLVYDRAIVFFARRSQELLSGQQCMDMSMMESAKCIGSPQLESTFQHHRHLSGGCQPLIGFGQILH